MTTPKVTTTYVSGDRWYVHEGSGHEVPGVSAIKAMLPSPALSNWFKKATAEYCVDQLEMIARVAEHDKDAAIDLVKNSTSRSSRKKADRGTEVHAMCEEIMRAQINEKKAQFKATGDDMKYLRNFARFIKEFEVKPVMVETTIWSKEHLYAGTFDLLCTLKGRDGYYIVDYKTGASGIWPDAGIQQTGYRWADSYIDEAGAFQTMPPIAGAFGLWLRPEGWALTPLRTDEAMWDVFLHLRALYDFKMNIQQTVCGKPVNETPLKRQWKGKR